MISYITQIGLFNIESEFQLNSNANSISHFKRPKYQAACLAVSNLIYKSVSNSDKGLCILNVLYISLNRGSDENRHCL